MKIHILTDAAFDFSGFINSFYLIFAQDEAGASPRAD
jgi:hypothetical protein